MSLPVGSKCNYCNNPTYTPKNPRTCPPANVAAQAGSCQAGTAPPLQMPSTTQCRANPKKKRKHKCDCGCGCNQCPSPTSAQAATGANAADDVAGVMAPLMENDSPESPASHAAYAVNPANGNLVYDLPVPRSLPSAPLV